MYIHYDNIKFNKLYKIEYIQRNTHRRYIEINRAVNYYY